MIENVREYILSYVIENPDWGVLVNALFDEIREHFFLFSLTVFMDLGFFNIYLKFSKTEIK